MYKFDELEEKNRQRIKRLINLCHTYIAQYRVISVKPLIFFIQIDLDNDRIIRDYKFLFDSLKNQKAYVICSTYWYLENFQDIDNFNNLLEKFKIEYPNFTFIVLCNTLTQLDRFTEKNIKAIFCNNNCFVDENIFAPLPNLEKNYDAIYDARLVEWKRHNLAAEIDNLALIYYAIPWFENNSYMNKTINNLSHARFFNHTENGECKKLNPFEVNQALNQCRVGLCLSAEEGAMFASIQYLLAGLPVVTTPSLGGRDVFFDDEISITVKASSNDVKAGVDEIIKRNLSPEFIRAKTIKRIKKHRGNFISLIQDIYEQEGVNRNFSEEWENIFTNKLLKNTNHLETLAFLKSFH